MSDPVYIVGVDPGVTTGICVIEIWDGKWRLLKRMTVDDVRDGGGLCALATSVTWSLLNYVPAAMAMEQMMAYKTSAQEKAEAQGVIRLAAYQRQIPMHTYAPTMIRTLVVGSGCAKASDIAKVTRELTGITHAKKGEAFDKHQQDALAAALCCALKEGYLNILEPQEAP